MFLKWRYSESKELGWTEESYIRQGDKPEAVFLDTSYGYVVISWGGTILLTDAMSMILAPLDGQGNELEGPLIKGKEAVLPETGNWRCYIEGPAADMVVVQLTQADIPLNIHNSPNL